MIDTLRLARRWRDAKGDADEMVEALAEALGEHAATKQDVQILRQDVRAAREATKEDLERFRDATKQDLERHREETRQDIERLRAETKQDSVQLRASTKQDIEVVRAQFSAELKTEIAQLRNHVYGTQVALLIVLLVALYFK